jgi:hypothetical protein
MAIQPSAPHKADLLGWLGVCLLLVLQYALFLQFAQREIVWGYPMAYDQTTFLSKAYETFDRMLSSGFFSGLEYGISIRIPQGNLLHLQASLVYFLLGPSRLSSITLNFAHFALFQCALVWVVLWFARSWSIAYLAMGLLWTSIGRFMIAGGGITDFRPDFISICLFGLAICVVIRSELLANLAWAPAVGAVVAYLVLFRYITAAYVVGITGVCFLVLVVRRGPGGLLPEGQSRRRLRGLVGAAGAFLLLAMPVMIYSRQAIADYYFRGHLGPDKDIRKVEAGTTDLFKALLYYPRSLLYMHIGVVFIGLILATFLTLLVFAWRYRGSGSSKPTPPAVGLSETFLFLSVCLLVPFAILTLDPSKSPVVGGVLLMPILWLVVVGVTALRGRIGADSGGARALPVLGVVAVICGIAVEFQMATRRSPLTLHRDDTNQVLALYDLFARETRQNGWSSPRVAYDRLEDYLHPQTIPVVIYERHQKVVNPRIMMGGSIFAVPEQAAIAALENSDFAILTEDRSAALLRFEYFPFNLTMSALRPKLREAALRTMIPLQRFRMSFWDVVLYMRPSVGVEGGDSGWILSDGLILKGDAVTMRARPEIELRGEAMFQSPVGTYHSAEIPGVAAHWSDATGSGKPIQAEIRKEGKDYRIRLSLRSNEIPEVPTPHIQISFDRSFVPRDKGYNDDPRHLVLPMPERISLLPR